MGAALSLIVPIASAVAGLLIQLRSQPAGDNPTHNDIEAANRLQQEQQERDRAAQAATEEADRLAREAEMNAQRAREAQAAMEAAQAEVERIRREAEEARVAAERTAEAEHHEAQRREQQIREEARRAVEAAQQEALRQQQLAEEENRLAAQAANRLQQEQQERDRAAQAATEEADRLAREAEMNAQRTREAQAALEAAQAEAERIKREAEEARVAAERAAEAEQHEAQRREQKIREEAMRAVEAAQQEALRQQQLAEEENRLASKAQRAAEEAARVAADEVRAALEAKAEVERQLREGIQPVVMPSAADLEDAKRRFGYRDGLYHFAVAGVAGSGKSSLINALRGLRNRSPGAAETGITETTLRVTRFLDSDPKNPFVWYDIPGAGTLQVRDWQYFNEQGLYVFDALVVLIDNRFTMTDIAILRNARLFGIPCYIVRSKADSHVRNLMREMGYESDDEEQDGRSRAKLESAAREHFVSATRQNVQENLRGADLPEQRVYIVSNLTMLSATKGNVATKTAKKIIDEFEFLQDLLGDAYTRRGGVAKAKGPFTAVA